jgi:hypothetical protein
MMFVQYRQTVVPVTQIFYQCYPWLQILCHRCDDGNRVEDDGARHTERIRERHTVLEPEMLGNPATADLVDA